MSGYATIPNKRNPKHGDRWRYEDGRVGVVLSNSSTPSTVVTPDGHTIKTDIGNPAISGYWEDGSGDFAETRASMWAYWTFLSAASSTQQEPDDGPCPKCDGTGRYRDPRIWGTMPGSATCDVCQGTGRASSREQANG